MFSLQDSNSTTGAAANKKIIFSDDEPEEKAVATSVRPTDKPIKKQLLEKGESKKSNQKKRPQLIDSDGESDSEKERAKTLQMFESKINLNEKKANQVCLLK